MPVEVVSAGSAPVIVEVCQRIGLIKTIGLPARLQMEHHLLAQYHPETAF